MGGKSRRLRRRCVPIARSTRNNASSGFLYSVLGHRTDRSWNGELVNAIHSGESAAERHRVQNEHAGEEDCMADNRIIGWLQPTRGKPVPHLCHCIYFNSLLTKPSETHGSSFPQYTRNACCCSSTRRGSTTTRSLGIRTVSERPHTSRTRQTSTSDSCGVVRTRS